MKHPFESRDLTKLEVTLWRMRIAAHEGQEILRGCELTGDVASVLNGHLLFTIANQALIITSKFVEVWEDLGAQAKSDARIITARRITTPLIDRMLIWDGLREYRNTILAHSYLDKANSPVDPWDLLIQHKVPTYHAEILLLLQLVHVTTCAIMMVFSKEYLAITPLLSSREPEPSPGSGIRLGTEIMPTLEPLAREVTDNLKAAGFAWVPLIAQEFKKAVAAP